MSTPQTYPFDELKAELIDHIHDMGPDFFVGTLDAVLLESSGGLVAEGVTKEMYEGQVISGLTACDMIAVSLGETATMLDVDMLQVAAVYAEDLQEIEGIADLAERVLTIFSDQSHPIYGDCTAELDRAAYSGLVSSLKATIASAKQRYPGEWVEMDGQGMFEVTMYPDAESDAKQ